MQRENLAVVRGFHDIADVIAVNNCSSYCYYKYQLLENKLLIITFCDLIKRLNNSNSTSHSI